MDKSYGNLIWTDHALQKLSERQIAQGDAWLTWSKPDQSSYAKAKGAWVYHKTLGNRKVEVVAKKGNDGKWVILSVWSKKIV